MDHNNVVAFIGFFLTGLAVNLTPCVYPMLTVTVSLFKPKKAAEKTLGHSFGKAFAYFLGIAVMYSSLGYFAASTGKLFGSFLQEGWVLAVVSFMMFALAFSMFGLYQIAIPVEVLNHMGKWRKVDYVGLFVSGMLVGIFAAPCIGPPVLALLAAVAQNGNPLFGFSAFLVFSFGLSLPYLFLGTFSHLIHKLPKAGNWLIWVEQAFGIVLFGFGFTYLLAALHSPYKGWVWPIVFIMGGIYLGFVIKAGHEKQIFVYFKRAVGLLALVTGLALASSQLPNKTHTTWQPFSPQMVQEAKDAHTPVIIDFYADWCVACHELDQMVFSNPKMAPEFTRFKLLRVDATNADDPKIQALFDQYGVVGLPTVIFIDSKGNEVKSAKVEGAVSPKYFHKSLSQVQ